jgi:two-component system nitrogen regulation response regulator GlnG
VLTPDCLPANIRKGVAPMGEWSRPTDERLEVTELVRRLLRDGETELYRKVLFAVDRAVIQEILMHVNDNQVEAARRLGISRTTLRAKLQSLRIVSGSLTSDPEHSDQ